MCMCLGMELIPQIERCWYCGWFCSEQTSGHRCLHPIPIAQEKTSAAHPVILSFVTHHSLTSSSANYRAVSVHSHQSYYQILQSITRYKLQPAVFVFSWKSESERAVRTWTYGIIEPRNWAAAARKGVVTKPVTQITEIDLGATAVWKDRQTESTIHIPYTCS